MKNLHTKKTDKNAAFVAAGVFSSALFVTASAVYLYSPTFGSHAAESKDAEVNLTVSSRLALRTSADELNLTANVGDFVHDSINVDVSTNSQYGYTLTLEDSDDSSNMTHANPSVSDVVTSEFSGAKTSAQMEDNTWGFSLDATDYFYIPVAGNPAAIKRTTSVVSGDYDTTTVYFGAKVGMTLTAGDYTDTVKFTAYVNGADNNPENGTNPSEPGTIVDNSISGVITSKVGVDPQVVADDPDNNPRYIGRDPNNYVTFNGETWRVIGVFGGRTKIMRDEPLAQYSWDSTGDSINENMGVNEWSTSKLAAELNGDYLDTTLTANTKWYDGSSLQKTGTFDISKRLTAAAQDLIDTAIWYTASPNNNNGYDLPWNDEALIASYMYTNERGDLGGKTCTSRYSGCTDTVERTTRWNGVVGLIYPSDFLYSTAGGTSEDRQTCLNTAYWVGHADCYNNSWMHDRTMWTMTPRSNWSYATYPYAISDGMYVYGNWDAAFMQNVHPVVFLKAGVKISGGTGELGSPYTLVL